jgi:hypothetical protein
LNTKYLPADFHTKTAIRQLLRLAKEKWEDMGEPAELVVLCMGLALRDVAAVVSSNPDTERPADEPEWVRNSPWEVDYIDEVLDEWVKQLDTAGEESSSHEDKGNSKGKGKANAKNGKKRTNSASEGDVLP